MTDSAAARPTNSTDVIPAASASTAAIRVGSPFALVFDEATAKSHGFAPPADTIRKVLSESDVRLYEAAGILYPAMGATIASAMVLTFATLSVWLFPGGGLMVAGLGSVLGICGLFSKYRWTSAGLILANLTCFLFCFAQTLG
ncbi:MAG: hypothetical protein AAGA03_10760 [Planctomycetota bacterium]